MRRFPVFMNLPFVVVDVKRRTLLDGSRFRLRTLAATVQGFKARIFSWGNFLPELVAADVSPLYLNSG